MRQMFSAAALAAILVAGLGATSVAWAQSGGSVQDTINALTPRPGKSRGSRPVVAPPGSPLPTAAAPRAALRPVATATNSPAASAGNSVAADAPPSIDFNILFASGSAELSPKSMQMLDVIGKALSSAQLSSQKFRIEGHTDTVGTPDGNRALSASRASAVVDFLNRKYNIDRSRLEAIGVGQDGLVVQTGAQVDEPRNRLVRIINVTG